MNSRAAGLAAAVMFLLIAGGQVYLALDLSRGTLAEPGPGLFPLIVGTLMGAALLLCFWPAVSERNPARFDLRGDAARLTVLVSVFALFILLVPRVGFILPSMLLQSVTLQVFGMQGLWRRLAVAAAITAAAVLIFETLLAVRFPTPSWSF
jgi:hypothetical protein